MHGTMSLKYTIKLSMVVREIQIPVWNRWLHDIILRTNSYCLRTTDWLRWVYCRCKSDLMLVANGHQINRLSASLHGDYIEGGPLIRRDEARGWGRFITEGFVECRDCYWYYTGWGVKVVAAFLAARLRNEPGTVLFHALITTWLIVKTLWNSTVKLLFSHLRSLPSFPLPFLSLSYLFSLRDRGGTVVKVLRYKSEGRWFDSRWCHWNFSLT